MLAGSSYLHWLGRTCQESGSWCEVSLAPRVVGDGTVRVSPHGPYRGEARPGGVTVPDMRLTAWDKLRRCSAIQCNVSGDETRRSPLSRQRECQGRDETAEVNFGASFCTGRYESERVLICLFYVDVLTAVIFETTLLAYEPRIYSLSRWHVAISESSCSDPNFSEGDK